MAILLTSDISFHELRPFLEEDGQKVRICNVKDAPLDIEKEPIETVILDWGSDAQEGLLILRKLKVTHPEIPVIVIAGASSEETAIDAFRLGAKDYFKKPVNLPEVREVLKNLVRLKRSGRERRFPYLTREGMISSLIVSATTTMPSSILRAVTFMADNFSKAMSLEEVAKAAGMSKYHLCRNFKKAMGMSPMQFLAATRIERAKKLMTETSLSATRIAIEVGFNDTGSFSARFKKMIGATPSAFRQSLRTHRT
jgi:YesN/AraC family two-component response regulator